jgi:D-amino-acid dehydrogenase
MTPDMFPVIKQSTTNPKVWYNTGHGHLGWTQAAGSAELLVTKIKQTL